MYVHIYIYIKISRSPILIVFGPEVILCVLMAFRLLTWCCAPACSGWNFEKRMNSDVLFFTALHPLVLEGQRGSGSLYQPGCTPFNKKFRV